MAQRNTSEQKATKSLLPAEAEESAKSDYEAFNPAMFSTSGQAKEPDFWDDLRDSLPPWFDEIIAIALLIFGVLSALALFDSSQALVAVAWSNILRSLFGMGGILVSLGLFAFGGSLLLNKAGMRVRIPVGRVLAIEVAFLCILALLHLVGDEPELRALARAGEGGGMIGWGLTAVPFWLLGRAPTILLFLGLLALSVAYVAGLQRRHLTNAMIRMGQKLHIAGQAMADDPDAQPMPEILAEPDDEPIWLRNRAVPIMRIRPDLNNIPPSMRPGAIPDPKEPVKDIANHPLFKSTKELKLDFNLIGELTSRRSEDGHRLVRRPDGREKRYFSVSEMQESKKISKREVLLPPLEILADIPMSVPDEKEINHTVVLIENTLLEFDIDIDIVDVQVGPTVTRFAVQPYHLRKDGSMERTRLNKIASYSNDLSLALSAKRLRMEIPVPGTNYMGIEVPNKQPSTVALRTVYESKDYFEKSRKNNAPLLIPLGRDVSGAPMIIDLAKLPHILIAGTTGSGKSVCIAAIAAALVLNNNPDRVKLIMLDPKMVELSRFNGLPHLLGPVETDTDRIIGVLKWCTREMDRRYKLLEEHAVRNIDNYNQKFGMRRRGRDYMPHIVIMIDEIGDLMLSRPEETETSITRLAQMARAVGMHLVVATQRPSVDVITGLIKANFPGRIAFSVASSVDSRVILDSSGAETLLGNGDMLYLAPDAAGPRRVQGCFISDEEVRQIVGHWTSWFDIEIKDGRAERIRTGPWERGLTRREFLAETDPMLEDAIEYVVETQEASASILQRRLGLGYPRAARIVDMLEELGVVGEPVGGGRARRVLIAKGEDPFKRIIEKRLEEKENGKKQRVKPLSEYEHLSEETEDSAEDIVLHSADLDNLDAEDDLGKGSDPGTDDED